VLLILAVSTRAWLRVIRGQPVTLTPLPAGPDHRHIPGSGAAEALGAPASGRPVGRPSGRPALSVIVAQIPYMPAILGIYCHTVTQDALP
jgi:hypothetical protein